MQLFGMNVLKFKALNFFILLLILSFWGKIQAQEENLNNTSSRSLQNFFNRGTELFKQQQYDSAAFWFGKALEQTVPETNPTLVAEIFINLSKIKHYQNKNQTALQIAQRALGLFSNSKIKDKNLQARLNHLIGRSYWYLGDYNKSLNYYLKSKTFYVQLGADSVLSGIYNTIGTIQWSVGNLDLAVENYKIALNLAQKTYNFDRQARVLNNIGLVYQSWKRWQEALDYHVRALKVAENVPDGFGYIYSKINIGLVALSMGQYDQALEMFGEARNYFEKSNDLAGLAYISKYLGDVFDKQGKNKKALDYYLSSLNFGKQTENNYRICEALLNIGRIHQQQFAFDRAKEYFEKSLTIARQKGYKKIIYQNYENLALLYKEEHDYEKSVDYLYWAMALKDSMLNDQKLAALSDMQLQLQLEHQENENDLLKSKNKINELELRNEKYFRWGLIIFILFGFVLLFLLLHRWRVLRRLNNALKGQNVQIKKMIDDKEKLIGDLEEALDNISTLQNLLPICSNCKNIRDDEGYWQSVESYISSHTYVKFSHGLCPDCAEKLYPDIYQKIKNKK